MSEEINQENEITEEFISEIKTETEIKPVNLTEIKTEINMQNIQNQEIFSLHCVRCGHTWIPRKKVIVICPKCKSPYWNRLKLEKKELPKDAS